MTEQDFWDAIFERAYNETKPMFVGEQRSMADVESRIIAAAMIADKALKLRRGESND